MVLRQTEEANLIVASSYNAVVKWSLNNSLYIKELINAYFIGVPFGGEC